MTARGEGNRPVWAGWRLFALAALVLPLSFLRPESRAQADERKPATPIAADSPVAPANVEPLDRTSMIGRSVADRPLIVHQFGDGEPAYMIIADIHGGYEWNTRALADALIDHLEQEPTTVPDDITLYVLPSMNPDGDARSRGYEGRANENGVDLNRNFPFDWQETWKPTGCWNYLPIGAGRGPLSEPESQAVARFLLSNHIRALLSYHSAGLGIFAGGQPTDPSSASLAEAIAAVTDYPYPPRETGCEFTGEMVDWAAMNGISAVDVELSTHYSLDLSANLRVLEAFLHWER